MCRLVRRGDGRCAGRIPKRCVVARALLRAFGVAGPLRLVGRPRNDPAGAPLASALGSKRTRQACRVHRALEGVNGHKLGRLSDLLRHTRVPVLDAHEDAVAVVVPRVAYIQREADVPEGRPRPPTDVARGELARYLLEDVLHWVVCEMACQRVSINIALECVGRTRFEHLSIPELAVCWVECLQVGNEKTDRRSDVKHQGTNLLGSVIPRHCDPRMSLLVTAEC